MASKIAVLTFTLLLTSAIILSSAYPTEGPTAVDEVEEQKKPLLLEGILGEVFPGFKLKEFWRGLFRGLQDTASRVDDSLKQILKDAEPYLPPIITNLIRKHY
ncbi:unnamed protein product [Dibothriocephalus latus]|uniref:Uncharacterized protein n=1 Tax=Dibothriocephalus latus TaxID=60516 RepID=A0A3P7NQ51_DIBLA|nr:unnamed protein product [Dibothriocephalus latus]